MDLLRFLMYEALGMMYDKAVFGSPLLVRGLLVVPNVDWFKCSQLPRDCIFAWMLVTCTCKHLRL